MPKDKINYTLSKLNSFNTHLQFTYECENPADQTLPFLDLKLHRLPSQTVRVDWYNKPTASNCLLNFHSCHDYNQKINVATAFARRVITLSDASFHKKNKILISNILTKNNYPRKITNRIIRKVSFLNTNSVELNCTSSVTQSSSNTERTETPRNIYNSLHYVPHLSHSIKRTFQEKSNFNNIIFSSKPVKQIKNSVHANMKDKIIPENRSGVVYKIDCLDCEQSYVGETSKKLSTRVDQHRKDFKNKLSPGPKTALITHSLDHHHKFDFNSPTILDYETNMKKRRLLEASHIIINSPRTVNIKSDTRNISAHYYNILDRYKNNLSPSQSADREAQDHSPNPVVYPHR
jgi:hypothetical protein